MSHINEKLGLPHRAGKRSMMKLPKNLHERSRLTAAQCPACQRRAAMARPRDPGWVFCTWCNHVWQLATE